MKALKNIKLQITSPVKVCYFCTNLDFMSVKRNLIILGIVLLTNLLHAQCDSIIQQMDEFDSTLVVISQHVNVGYSIPSSFETIDGPKMVEEGKILFSYGTVDTVGSFYMSLALAERNFQTISDGKDKVLLLTKSGKVESLLSFSDKGVFDKNTNMRIYIHACLIPLDLFYLVSYDPIVKIRVYYDNGYKRTIELTQKQQEAIKQQLLCVGETVGIFPKKP